jgi:phosphatidylserine/phosphatidylglycerophosphate/cardiolipin synthase-like enzyme
MAIKRIHAFANCDEATIVWQTEALIPGCRGFALERQIRGKTQTSFLPTWVGFKGQKHQDGESRPSTEWPIQRYMWSDYLVQFGQQVRYRAIPMIGSAGSLEKAPEVEWSDWTPWETIGTGQAANIEAYFNRGIVPSQWLARQHPTKKSLQQDLDTKGSRNRDFLSGELRKALLRLLAQAKEDGVEIYAALYELNDPELIEALKAIGGKCNLVLGSGAYKPANKKKGTPAVPDENEEVRKDLQQNSSVNVHDRLVKSPHFAHNKFVVCCDKKGTPASVWTGSTNWTMTGLCTQVNNGILIPSPKLAGAYRTRWVELKDAGANYPATLAAAGSVPARDKVAGATITAWNTPVSKLVDLEDAKKRIEAAAAGVIFLMFNPGPKNTLLNTILALDTEKLFIHGVVNQDPGGKKAPLINLTHKGTQLPSKRFSAILPASLQNSRSWFDKEFTFNRVMIHSKVVVIDPFGKKPVVMTGSHNMGPKASGKNDDNILIIENAPGLASEYAVNILGVYGHFKWLFNQSLRKTKGEKASKKASPQYDGNFDDDKWQKRYAGGVNLRENEFWLG